MFGSKNTFFEQTDLQLKYAGTDLAKLLQIKGRSLGEIKEYMQAYKFFKLNPERYDGATIVKDLVDVRSNGKYLDADAMLHDFEYIQGANVNFKKKWKADVKYIKNMEKNGKGVRITRFVLLTITGVLFVPYVIIKNKFFKNK